MAIEPLLIPDRLPRTPGEESRRRWTLPAAPSELAPGERFQRAQTNFLRSFLYLQTMDMALLEDLSRAGAEGRPFEVYVDGAEPDLERLFAVLRCAFQFRAAVTVRVGHPQETSDFDRLE